MARIDVLPSVDIIRGLKGILDFYLWRGLPCVRAWPRWRPARQSDASTAAALLFGAIIKAYSRVGPIALPAYQDDAADQPRSARDIMVTGVFGNLHEASMSDFLTLLTDCRDFLSDLTLLLNALDSIDTDELVVNVDESVLPPLAATTTNQATAITALQKLDDLQDALESKGLDRLLVRGMDQLHSYENRMAHVTSTTISGANGYIDSGTPGAGYVWHVTSIIVWDQTSPTTQREAQWSVAGQWPTILFHTGALAAAQKHLERLDLWLQNPDFLRVYFTGAQINDNCRIHLTGETFTIEP